MFDIGFWEMAFIGVISLIIIGPERLPGVARNVGLWVGKGRRMLNEVKSDVKREMKEYDLDQVKALKTEFDSASKDLKDIKKSTSDTLGLKQTGAEIKQTVDGISASVASDSSKVDRTVKKKTAKKKKGATRKPITKKATRKSPAKPGSSKPVGKKQPVKKSPGKKTTQAKKIAKPTPGKKK